MAEELGGAGVPGKAERMGTAGRARDRQRPQAGLLQILVERASATVADDIAWACDGIGGHGHSAGQRLELNDAEGVGPAWKDENVGRRHVSSEPLAAHAAQKIYAREACAQRRLLRAFADNDLAAG